MDSASRKAEGHRRFRGTLSAIPRDYPNPYFVKVGANDGVTADPCSDILLGSSAWSGLLIEPVPYLFRALRENFSDPSRFTLAQVLVSREEGSAPFYYLREDARDRVPELPEWYDKIGSVDRDHILKHLGPAANDYIVEQTLPVQALSQILSEQGISTFEFLHIDAEGHDFEVLKGLDFSVHTPLAILLEQKHLSGDQREAVYGFLEERGYDVFAFGGEIFALHESAPRRLRKKGGFSRFPFGWLK